MDADNRLIKKDPAESIPFKVNEFSTQKLWHELPYMLVEALERRYLNRMNPLAWQLAPTASELTQPVLRMVTQIGSSQVPPTQIMPYVLTGCHEPGHAVVMVLHGDGTSHRLYLGTRRLLGYAARSTRDYLELQTSAFRTYFPGLDLSQPWVLDHTNLARLDQLLQRAPSLLAITGIPLVRTDYLSNWQSLDQITAALGTQPYALMIVAEPVLAEEIDSMLDRARQLKSEVHSYARVTLTHSKAEGDSESLTVRTSEGPELPSLLYGLATFCQAAGIFGLPQASALGQGLFSMGMGISYANASKTGSRTTGTNSSVSEGMNVELINDYAIACEALLDKHIERLLVGRGGSFWKTAVYAVAENEATTQAMFAALRSVCTGDSSSGFEPIRATVLPRSLQDAVRRGQLLQLQTQFAQDHPMGSLWGGLFTCTTAAELGTLINLPQREIPGIPQRETAAFAVTVPEIEEITIPLGQVVDPTGRVVGHLKLDSGTLNKHVFVTGLPGYGKTNTCMQLLLNAYEYFRVPFLVIEPAKSEYRMLAGLPMLAEELRIYSPGSAYARPLRLNPLEPVPGAPLGLHIDLLKAVFNASFSMYGGMHQVLEEALISVYTERGWSLRTGLNRFLPEEPTLAQQATLMPTLQDLHDQIEVVLQRKKYAQEVHQNLGAALRSRLQGLILGSKGETLNTQRSTPAAELFGHPTVIELKHLGDDEEKAFIMALLLVLLHEYAEVRQRYQPASRLERLQHLTLVEEAHRLLAARGGALSPDHGDPRSKAVEMFTDLLAEMRAYGEGFIVADQIPTKLAPEILKITNLKIVHRLVAGDDRMAVGAALNLNDDQQRYLNLLTPGLSVVHNDRIGKAVLIQVDNVKQQLSHRKLSPIKLLREESLALMRHSGCKECAAPCQYYGDLEDAGLITAAESALLRCFDGWLLGDDETFIQEWQHWSSQVDEPDRRFCLAAQAGFTWVGLRIRENESAKLNPTQRLRQDEAAALLSPMIQTLVRGKVDRQALSQVRSQVAKLLVGELPSLPGCSTCPVRCRAFPIVRTQLNRLRSMVAIQLAQSHSETTRLAAIQQSATTLISGLSTKTEEALLYCLVANSGGDAASEADVLDLLRSKLGC
nr:MAG: ATP-binding protein [Leptolyngbya sp. IPPAS B-1204]